MVQTAKTSTTGSVFITLTTDSTSAAIPVVVKEDVYKGTTLVGTTYRNISFSSTYTPQGLASYAISNLPMLFSMRLLWSTYAGPLVKLRRVSDNATSDFYSNGGTLDTFAVNTWLAGSTATIDTWYNQGSGPNATAPSTAQQPVMQLTGPLGAVYNGTKKLIVPMDVLLATNNGVEGTVLIICTGATATQDTFGANDSTNTTNPQRWCGQINWSDGKCYFDGGGVAIQSYRSFTNSNVTTLSQYTFKRNTTTQVLRKRGVTQQTGAHTGAAKTSTGFGIGCIVGGPDTPHTGTISEFIMSNTAMTGTNFTTVENDQISYWGV